LSTQSVGEGVSERYGFMLLLPLHRLFRHPSRCGQHGLGNLSPSPVKYISQPAKAAEPPGVPSSTPWVHRLAPQLPMESRHKKSSFLPLFIFPITLESNHVSDVESPSGNHSCQLGIDSAEPPPVSPLRSPLFVSRLSLATLILILSSLPSCPNLCVFFPGFGLIFITSLSRQLTPVWMAWTGIGSLKSTKTGMSVHSLTMYECIVHMGEIQ